MADIEPRKPQVTSTDGETSRAAPAMGTSTGATGAPPIQEKARGPLGMSARGWLGTALGALTGLLIGTLIPDGGDDEERFAALDGQVLALIEEQRAGLATLDSRIGAIGQRVDAVAVPLSDLQAGVTGVGTVLSAQVEDTRTRNEALLTAIARETGNLVPQVERTVAAVEDRVDALAGTVTTALDGQDATIDAIAANVDEVAGSVDEVAGNVDDVTNAVDRAADNVDGLAERVDTLAGEFQGATGRIELAVGQFDLLASRIDLLAERVEALGDERQARPLATGVAGGTGTFRPANEGDARDATGVGAPVAPAPPIDALNPNELVPDGIAPDGAPILGEEAIEGSLGPANPFAPPAALAGTDAVPAAAPGDVGTGEGMAEDGDAALVVMVPLGQTAELGPRRIAVRDISDGTVRLEPDGYGVQEVPPGSGLDFGDGCMVRLTRVTDNAVTMSARGCEG